ncbi:PTS system, mannose-specific IIB component/PTS system, fructoselysine and glucoselysine-specific IIB component [Mucilaginibacter sp. OK268]|jgi:mannose/fructose/N-acetylgalactosamine-specific phosphotransferase system component IIB|uniref:PTS sugar transporter subunit IIB n=1 Tax=Mucilaginibacter sp. OK268 TaxID=1881048 RepID=UPI00087E602D|nr:PTS sugar transporter subunit IIB [Mucilaginibacter sp. OK268]SDP59866.1 PTS system, mannose-specific IIB component/PTS system, fructoselysine and glucoselysine-specific IIB component [Mucilaginibacter sp. OK268]
MIKLTRIDDRLVHGQVAMTWTPSLGADCLLVANDKAATDEFLKMTMNLAKPASAKLLIKTLADAITFLNDPRGQNMKILVLVNSVKDATTLAAGVSEIKSINFGGIRTKEGARSIAKALAVTDDDIIVIRDLLAKGIELEVRQVPTDNKTLIETLI